MLRQIYTIGRSGPKKIKKKGKEIKYSNLKRISKANAFPLPYLHTLVLGIERCLGDVKQSRLYIRLR